MCIFFIHGSEREREGHREAKKTCEHFVLILVACAGYICILFAIASCQVAEAGLVVGAITVVAGILGSVSGASIAQCFEPRWGSRASLGVPAGFTVPGATFLVAALAAGAACKSSSGGSSSEDDSLSLQSNDNNSSSADLSSSSNNGADDRGVAYLLLFVAQVCLWTQIAPVATVSVNAMPARLRARAACVSILVTCAEIIIAQNDDVPTTYFA